MVVCGRVVGAWGELGMCPCAVYRDLSGHFESSSRKEMIVLHVFCGLGEEKLGRLKSKHYVVMGVLRLVLSFGVWSPSHWTKIVF